MRATVNAAELAASVKVTAIAISARPASPVLAGVMLTPGDGHLELSTFDFDSAARSRCAAKVNGDPVLVSHRLLSNVVSTVKSGEITLDDDGGALVVTSGRSVWQLPRMDVSEYPTLPEVGESFAVVDGPELARAVEVVESAAADEPAANLDCIYLGIEDGALTLAGCNRHRLHVAEVSATVSDGAGEFLLVPARRLLAMTKHLGGGEVRLRRTSGLFALSDAGGVLSTRLTEPEGGKWIKFEQLLAGCEDNAKATVTLDRDHLLGALRQVAGFAGEAAKGARHISLTFERSGELSLIAGSAAEGSGTTVIDTEHDGPGIRVTANVGYLIDAVTTLESPAARLTFQSPTHPIGIGCEGRPLSAVSMPVGAASAGAWLDEREAVGV